jgi:tetratricopeptide (TPR) repeat protein
MQVAAGRLARVLLPAGVLALFYWGLFLSPPALEPEPSASLPDQAETETRRLADLAKKLLRQDLHAEALAPTLKLHEKYPGNHIYIWDLATIYNRLGRPADEARSWEEYLQAAPTPIQACPALPRAYEKQNLTDKAFDAYERCLALDPKDPDAIFFLALACERRGKGERARALYARGLALAPEYADMRLGLARHNLRGGRTEEALKAAERVLAKSPDNVDALLVAGSALHRLGRLDEARENLERGLKKSETYADLHLALASLAADEKKYDEAMRHYNRALALRPGSREALDGLARLAGKTR